jgi:hypothetical protein
MEISVDRSIFIAQLLGPPILLGGASLLAHPSFYRGVAEDVQRSRALLYLFGMTRFIAGLAVVLLHNLWVADWRIIVTLTGWAAMLRGVLILVMPETAAAWARRSLERGALLPVAGAVAVALGTLLCILGYL